MQVDVQDREQVDWRAKRSAKEKEKKRTKREQTTNALKLGHRR